MQVEQKGLFQEGTTAFYFLEYQLKVWEKDLLQKALQNIYAEEFAEANVVVAFGNKCWNLLQPNWCPKDLKDFRELRAENGKGIPATQGDLLFWIHGKGHDTNFDAVLRIQEALENIAQLQVDLPGFQYHDSRDLIGFVDGSANPKDEKRQLAALIPEGEIGAGGSYVLSQKWVHKMKDFKRLDLKEQEKVVGRTKKESIELSGDQMPANSHVSRTDVKVNGKAMKIYRRSAPFGNAREMGLYFLAFACEIERFEIQLNRMFGLTEDGIQDRIIEFSDAVTSSYWFAPAQKDVIALFA